MANRSSKQPGGTVLIANPGADLYGSDRMMLETVEALRAAGWRVVVSVPHDGPVVPEVRRRGAEIAFCRTPVVRKAALKPAGALRLIGDVLLGILPALRLIRRVRPDVVYVSTITPFLWLLLSRLTGHRTICHVHEGEASASALVRRMINVPLLLAHRLVVNSQFSLNVLTESVSVLGRRADVVYNAVRGPAVPSSARYRLTPPYRLLYVGRLSPRKGPDVAIHALVLLRQRGVQATLDLIGDVFPGYEWFRADLDEMVTTNGLNGAVSFHGFSSHIWPHAAVADIMLVPSVTEEGFGNTAVEAALAARPAVVSDLAGLKEATAGLAATVRVAPGDAFALAGGVERIITEWPRMRAAAAEDAVFAASRCAPKSYADRIIDALDGVSR
jgi:glycosyltransferase involved in cell wall biosynthesis